MTPNKLEKIKREIAAARRRMNKHRDLEEIAISLGRKRATGDQARGKEPTYISTVFLQLRPLSIPDHSGRDIPPGTARNILGQLEEDVVSFESQLEKAETDSNSHEKGNDYEDSTYNN